MAEECVIACHTVDEWNHHFHEGKESKKLVVVDFTASWCGPCLAMAPIFAEMAKIFTDVIFLKVDVDELAPVFKEWKVDAMPTFIFLKEGEAVETLVGFTRRDELVREIALHRYELHM